jgi:hypothetical protein
MEMPRFEIDQKIAGNYSFKTRRGKRLLFNLVETGIKTGEAFEVPSREESEKQERNSELDGNDKKKRNCLESNEW